MEKKNSLKEDHEEAKLGDMETRSPVAETGPATVPLRAVLEERTVSFKLGDLEEVPELQRLPSVDLKEASSLDGAGNGEQHALGVEVALLCALWVGSGDPGLSALSHHLLLARCGTAARWGSCAAQPGCQQPDGLRPPAVSHRAQGLWSVQGVVAQAAPRQGWGLHGGLRGQAPEAQQ